MKILEKIDFDVVLNFFDANHPIQEKPITFNGNKWARKILIQTNNDLPQPWAYTGLDLEEILNIIFPKHTSEGGLLELVSEEGMTVEETLKKLKGLNNYSSQSPTCFQKILYWQNKDFTPIFLTAKPIMWELHSLLGDTTGKLVSLDGLHRLICWGLSGKYEKETYKGSKKLTAYIAGL